MSTEKKEPAKEINPPPLKAKPFVIKQRKISELKPAEYNPRTLSEKQFKDLKKSFMNLGTLEPAVINVYPGRENVIISGHQRIKVATDLGMTEYPCLEVSFPPKKEKEANIRMNKNTGEWDLDILANQFIELDLLEWGFLPKEIEGRFYDLDSDPTPNEFKDVSESISTEHKCPKCGYKWSGNA